MKNQRKGLLYSLLYNIKVFATATVMATFMKTKAAKRKKQQQIEKTNVTQ
jgi:hypothetical protein